MEEHLKVKRQILCLIYDIFLTLIVNDLDLRKLHLEDRQRERHLEIGVLQRFVDFYYQDVASSQIHPFLSMSTLNILAHAILIFSSSWSSSIYVLFHFQFEKSPV